MKKSSMIPKILGFIALAVALGVLIGWYVSHQGDLPPPITAVVAPAPPAPETNAPLVPKDSDGEVAATPEPEDTNAEEPPPGPKTWEQQLDDVLLSSDDDATKASKIIDLMPLASPEGQVELSQHLVNMVQDDNYDGTAALLTNAVTPSGVSTVLMNDLLNRNNGLKLPMLLAIARNDDHPLKGQARDMLELFLQEDKGTNWDDWQSSIDQWLKDNPP